MMMEYFPSQTLLDYIQMQGQDEGLGEMKARAIFKQLIDALEYMDKMNICHRDINMVNILIDEKLNIKLVDFS